MWFKISLSKLIGNFPESKKSSQTKNNKTWKEDIEFKPDHPDDHAKECGCSTCKTRRSWLTKEKKPLQPPQVQTEGFDNVAVDNGDLKEELNEEKLNEPIVNSKSIEASKMLKDVWNSKMGNCQRLTTGLKSNEMLAESGNLSTKTGTKRQRKNSPFSSEADPCTLSLQQPTEKKEPKRQKREPLGMLPITIVPTLAITNFKDSQKSPQESVSTQALRNEHNPKKPKSTNKSDLMPSPSIPKRQPRNTLPTSTPVTLQSNPQILSQVLTMMRAEIVQEIKEQHLELFNNLSKRLSNMEKLIVQIAKAQSTDKETYNIQKEKMQSDIGRHNEIILNPPTPPNWQQVDSDDQEQQMDLDDHGNTRLMRHRSKIVTPSPTS